jgi:hypothetical protein
MRPHFLKRASVSVVAVSIVMLSISLLGKPPANDDDTQSKVQKGFAIAPVHLNLAGKNHDLVGLGSYIVNAMGGCNDCHSNPPYAQGGDPTMGQPKKVNSTTYLGGGALFIPPNPPNFPHAIVSRNLTPDKTGRPEGGASFEEFQSILRTGVDPDHAHPEYGPFLVIMPWPVYQDMTDRDLRAIYEYLSAIPCVEGDPGLRPDEQRPIGQRCK